MKKLIALLLAVTMVLSLCACGPKEDPKNSETNNDAIGDNTNGGNSSTDGSGKEQTPKEQMMQLEARWIEALTEALEKAAETGGNKVDISAMGMESDTTIRLSDELITMLTTNAEIPVDLTKLDTISIGMDMAMKDNLNKMIVDIGINGKELAKAEAVIDMAAMVIWAALPGLNDNFVKVDLGAMSGGAGMGGTNAATGSGMTDLMNKLPALLPDLEKTGNLLETYYKLALEGIDDVTREEASLALDGLKQDAVLLTYTITEEDLANIVLSVAQKAKGDAELKALIEKLSTELDKIAAESSGDTQPLNLYEQFVIELEQVIEDIEETDAFDDTNYIVIKTYLDKDGEIISRRVSLYGDGEEMLAVGYATVTDGNAFSSELYFTTAEGAGEDHNVKMGATLAGSGTVKSGVRDGVYRLTYFQGGEAMPLLKIELKDVVANQEKTSGTVILEPSAELLTLLLGGEAGVLDLALGFSWELDGSDVIKISLDVLMNEVVLVGFDTKLEAKTEVGAIKKPADAVDAMDNEAIQQWIQQINIQELLNRWTEAGMPELNLAA